MAQAPNLIDKGPYQAPQGVQYDDSPETMEVIVMGPDDEEVEEPAQEEADFYANLAETIPDGVLGKIARDLQTSIDEDLRARADWEKMYTEGINLLGLKYETRMDPWQGACGVFHPLITEAVIRFQADTMLETFPATGPVKTAIIGKLTEDKEKAAKRVEDDLNWQVMENMPEFRPEHERMLWNLPGTGCAFKKVYDCSTLGRQTSVFVPAEDVIIPYATTDIQTCERMAHRMRKTKLEAEKLMRSGFWVEVDIPDTPPPVINKVQDKKDKETGVEAINDTRPLFYEVAADICLEECCGEEADELDDIDRGEESKPYIFTFIANTDNVVAMRRNWKEGDGLCLKRQHFVQYNYVPGYGAYGFGLFHLLGGFATSATSIMRQLVDAGTLSNLPGGLKTKGLRIKGDDDPISPGEFRDVDVGSGTIRDNILPLPYKEPSATLYNLLLNIVEEGRRFAATNDIKVSDVSSQAPVGTTLAVLERQLRTMTAVQARVHFSLKQELRLLANIIKDKADEGYAYEVDAKDGSKAKLADYSYVSIIPVSDPNAATMSQRVVQYQAAVQLAQMAPEIYDQPELHRQMLTVLGIKNVGKLVPTEDDIKVVDPVQENQNIIIGKPVKSWAWQDHESHIRVHMAAMQDPLIQQMVGQNPKASMIMGAMTSHIAEHVGFAYRNKMSQAMGMPLPVLGKDDSLPPDVEVQLSRALAQAAPQVMQQSQQLVAQQQAQKNAQDPVLVAQQMEQQNAKAEIDRKMKKDETDASLEWKRLQLDAASKGIDPQTMQGKLALDAQKAQHQMSLEDQKASHQAQLDDMRMRQQQEQDSIRARHEQERHDQEQSIARARTSSELNSADQRRRIEVDRHRQEKQLREEKHRSEIIAKKKAAEFKAKNPGAKK